MHVSLLLISWTMTTWDAQPGSMDGADSETDFHSVTCSWRQREESLLEEFVYENGGYGMEGIPYKGSNYALNILQVKVIATETVADL